MAKQNKQITLDMDLLKKLSEVENLSGLINQLLKEYVGSGEDMKKDKIQKEIIETEKTIKELQNKLGNLNNALEKIELHESLLKQKFGAIPKDILEDFKQFTDMDENGLRTRYNNLYFNQYTCTFPQILEAFREWKKLK
jgi:predicted nuclease with TOPRIM domain